MYKSLSEIAAHKKRLWTKKVVPRKISSPCRLLRLIEEKSFFCERCVSLLHENSCGQRFLNRHGIFYKSTCSYGLSKCNVFDRYFYLRRIVISKKHLQSYVSVLWLLLQDGTCSDLVFSRVLCFFKQAFAVIPFLKGIELICHSSCRHSFNEWPFFYNKRAIAARFFHILLCFWRTGIIARRYHK